MSALTATALLVFGGHRVHDGTGTVEEAIALGFLAVGVVASYRSFAVHAGSRTNAVGNTALFAGAVAAYGGGVSFGVDPAMTAGQALFAIAVAYVLIRRA